MILDDVKKALGVTDCHFDDMISDLIEAADLDLGIAGVNGECADNTDQLYKRAVIVYCRMHFSMHGLPDGYEQLKKAYDEMKAQMQMATDYTTWGTE